MRDLLNDYFNKVDHFSEESDFLQKFIISLAVQGKLINKKSYSDSGKNLLNEIKKEKEFLIKKGENILLSTFDEKLLVPFKIPKNWEWSSLGEICSYIQRGKSPKYALKGPKVISQKCIQWSGLDLSVAKFIENESLIKYKKEQFLKIGDLLWNSTGTGTIGRVLKVNNLEEKLVCDSHVTILRCLKVNPDFVKIWLMSDFVYGLIEEKATGSTNQIELTKKIAIQQCVPIPPLTEQNIIVERVNFLCNLLKKLKEANQKSIDADLSLRKISLNKFLEKPTKENINFLIENQIEMDYGQIMDLIFKMAFSGKLTKTKSIKVSQENLDKVNKFRDNLLKQKTIKNFSDQKIMVEYFHKNIPSSWIITKLGYIGDWGAGSTPSRSNPNNYSGSIPWIKSGDLSDSFDLKDCTEYISDEALKSNSFRKNKSGDILIAMYGATIGKLSTLGIDAVTNQAVCGCTPFPGINSKFLFYYLLSCRKSFQKISMGGAQPNISKIKIQNFPFPLTGEKEQNEIVEKINNLLSLTKNLKNNIEKESSIKEELLQAVTNSYL